MLAELAEHTQGLGPHEMPTRLCRLALWIGLGACDLPHVGSTSDRISVSGHFAHTSENVRQLPNSTKLEHPTSETPICADPKPAL